MIHLHKLTLFMLAFCLMLTVAVPPALATAQAGSSDTSSPDTTKKPKKKAKKDKTAADTSAADSSGTASKPATTNPAPASEAPKKTKVTAGAAASPEIAAAQSSGKVWVNLDSGIYHKGGRWYGKTKNGKFMTEAEAKAAGYKESQKN